MKTLLATLTLLLLTSGIAACGTSPEQATASQSQEAQPEGPTKAVIATPAPITSSTLPSPTPQSIYALSAANLPACTPTNEDELAYVQGTGFEACESGVWTAISIAGPAGPAGATGSVGPVGATGNTGPTGAAGPAGLIYAQVGDSFLDPDTNIEWVLVAAQRGPEASECPSGYSLPTVTPPPSLATYFATYISTINTSYLIYSSTNNQGTAFQWTGSQYVEVTNLSAIDARVILTFCVNN